MDIRKIPTVHRITIDERLSGDLIRLEICRLIKCDELKEFKDDPEYWDDIANEGEEILARPSNQGKGSEKGFFAHLMGIPKSRIKKFPWKDLKEGQVFLSGEFVVREKKLEDKKIKRYFARSGETAFEQIDDDVKENTRNLYYELLVKGDKNV